MLKEEPNLETLLRTLQADGAGTISALRLISYLKTLPQDSRIGTSITHRGQSWFLSLNLSDLYQEQSGTETGKTRPTSNSPDGSR